MPFYNTLKSGVSRGSISSYHTGFSSGQEATILNQEYADGKIKVYVDSGKRSEKIELWPTDEKKIVIHKDLSSVTHISHYKDLQIMTADGQSLASLNVTAEKGMVLNPTYRFFDGNSYIGSGTGDFPYIIGEKLFNAQIDSRLTTGSTIDEDVIKFIQEIMHNSV
jgi:hypothetical protein